MEWDINDCCKIAAVTTSYIHNKNILLSPLLYFLHEMHGKCMENA